ncbi:dUTP diphosphatase [Peptoniphilus sp. HCN-40583]|uniref:dUTP diphosphatase n=1 Tax=Peptoniphilus sp. HCN-40583 TaxID=3134662 RepID=UPI0030BAE28F
MNYWNKKMYYLMTESDAKEPKYGTEDSAGVDIYYNGSVPVTIGPGSLAELETHLAVEIPHGCFGMLVVRSGYGWRGLSMLNSVGIIDCDYRGEIGIKLVNHGHEIITIEPGVRVAQMIVIPYLRVDLERVGELGETERGTGGFGSTGVR